MMESVLNYSRACSGQSDRENGVRNVEMRYRRSRETVDTCWGTAASRAGLPCTDSWCAWTRDAHPDTFCKPTETRLL